MARKKYTEEQIVRILKEAAAGAKTQDLRRKHGVSPNTFYAWRTKFVGMTVPDIKKPRALEEENLKRKVGGLTMDLDAAKDLLSKNRQGPRPSAPRRSARSRFWACPSGERAG